MSRKRKSQTTKVRQSPIEIVVAKLGLVGTIFTAVLGLVGVSITAYFGYRGIQLTTKAISTDQATANSHSLIASTYIPKQSEIPSGFKVKVDSATANLPMGTWGGDTYEIDYVNDNPLSTDGKILLFRVAVCPDETTAKQLYNSNFDAQWPDYFMQSVGDGRAGFTWAFDATKTDFNFGNVDDKYLAPALAKETGTGNTIGAMASIVFRSNNVVAVTTVYVQNASDATNQAIYYASLVVEKIQQNK